MAPMIVDALVSVVAAAAWKFLRARVPLTREEALDALGRRIRVSSKEAEFNEIEREIDRVLQTQLLKQAAGEEEAHDVVALNVAAHRLQNLTNDRRLMFESQQVGPPGERSQVGTGSPFPLIFVKPPVFRTRQSIKRPGRSHVVSAPGAAQSDVHGNDVPAASPKSLGRWEAALRGSDSEATRSVMARLDVSQRRWKSFVLHLLAQGRNANE